MYTATLIISLIQGTIIQYIIDNGAFDYQRYAQRTKEQIVKMILKQQ
jgi:hypothetical protein